MATGDLFLSHGRSTEHAIGDEIELPFFPDVWWKIEAIHERVDEEYQSTFWLEIVHGTERRLIYRDDPLKEYQLVQRE